MAFDFASYKTAPVVIGAPGTTSTDVEEGTTTEASVAVKDPAALKSTKDHPKASKGFDFTSYEKAKPTQYTSADIPGTPKQALEAHITRWV